MGGVAQRPRKAEGAGKGLTQSNAQAEAQPRPAGVGKPLARAFSATLQAWSIGRGRRYFMRACVGVQPARVNGPASSWGK